MSIHDRFAERAGTRPVRLLATAGLLVSFLTAPSISFAANPDDSIASLTNRSAIVVTGTVIRTKASADPMLAANDNTATIKVARMYAGMEIAGDQTGATVTVILRDAHAVKAGESAVFFGNPRFVGKLLTVADEGEIVPAAGAVDIRPEIEQALQARRDQPLRERLAAATRVFRARVESVRPLQELVAGAAAVTSARDEHDPEWQVATVRVISSLRGAEAGALSTVIFAGSRDIMWFSSPKLKVGDNAIILAHKPSERDDGTLREAGQLAFLEKQHADLVSQPGDVVPVTEEQRVRSLMGASQGGKP
jgi:hypothetical protein